jgi:hypothetical protein
VTKSFVQAKVATRGEPGRCVRCSAVKYFLRSLLIDLDLVKLCTKFELIKKYLREYFLELV